MKMFGAFLFLFIIESAFGQLWPKGVVHYTTNLKDYDLHSQDIIRSAFGVIEKEICVKFFNTPSDYNATAENRILYISNEDKRKTCPPQAYDFKKAVVNMPIGYKCVNKKDVAKIVVDMLRASIEQSAFPVNSFDLAEKFQDQDRGSASASLLSPRDRNFINAHYHAECGALAERPIAETRPFSGETRRMSDENLSYYSDKLWPQGNVHYGMERNLRASNFYAALKYAMIVIELNSCILFNEMKDEENEPDGFIWFSSVPDVLPALGYKTGNQTVSIKSVLFGDPGHISHTMNNIFRILGIPMMSNRYDRDNYISINWNNVEKGKEHYLEKTPEAATLTNTDGVRIAYSFDSVTHAPANFMCHDCGQGAQTVTPIQDHLWQKTLSMGHKIDLAQCDIDMLATLYNEECEKRKPSVEE